MAPETSSFVTWLHDAHVAEETLTPAQDTLLQRVFHFRQRCGNDYYSRRMLSHFLLHSNTGLSIAAIARLLDFSRAAASAQQGLSSKEVVQAAHHRLTGRAHGKLLPRFAGPVAQFLHEYPEATRYDLLDFIERTWQVRVSRMALHHFLKKYGLDDASRIVAMPTPGVPPPEQTTPSAAEPPPEPRATANGTPLVAATPVAPPEPGQPVPMPSSAFFLPALSTPGPSSCCPPPSTGSPRPRTASRTTTVP